MGFLRDIMDMPNQYEYSLKFFDRWYRPEHCALLVVGDVEHERLTALARKYYGAWKRGTFTLEVPAEPRQSAEKSVELPWKAQTLPVLALGYHGPAFSDREIDMPAMDVLSQVVFSPTSELFRKLVVEEQLVEFIQGGQQDSRDPGLFTVLTRIKDPSRIAEVRKEIDAAIERARTTPVPASRLAEVKSYQKYSYLMGLDNADAIARSICHYIAMTGDPEAVNRVYALYDRVTAEDVRRAAETYLAPANRTVVLLTHEGARQ
jgi:zinc protease